MKRRVMIMACLLCYLLGGCGTWSSRNYVSVTPHREENMEYMADNVSAANYTELREALETFVKNGTEQGVISVPNYNQDSLEPNINMIIRELMETHPIGAYAVESIHFEIGTNGGQPAIAMEIHYLHDRSEIRRIKQVDTMSEAYIQIQGALDNCDTGAVMWIKNYENADIAQMVEDYADAYPERVMERPDVTVSVYPERGFSDRVVEIKFTYQTSRETLRTMQTAVSRIFDSAVLYVSGDGADQEKFSQLYSFLMERYDYRIDTSITPAYSLLRHGVGDSKAFAIVYAAMCRLAGLECLVVLGTRNGEPWYWNIVHDGEQYCHVDLLRCAGVGEFQELSDGQMDGYVWDYSRFPECVYEQPGGTDVPAETEPQESTATEPADGDTTEETTVPDETDSSSEPSTE